MIDRRGAALVCGMGLLVAHRRGHGQPAATMRRVGILHPGPEADGVGLRTPFKLGMHDLGWLEGKNVEYRVVAADYDVIRLDALARELVEGKVDVIVAGSSVAVRAAQRATKTVPIVMAGVGDPVGQGFVASLARPGGNITGIANQADELLSKLIQILHEVAPQSRRVAILLNESNPQGAALYRAAGERACAALGLTAIWVVASVSAQLPGAVEQTVRQRAQAVVVVSDPLYYSERFKLQALLQAIGLPVACGHRENVVAGGLLGYTSNYAASFRYAAKFVDKILKGAKPAELPAEQPTRFELVINLKTAKALGIRIPQSVLLRADEVIE
jgi:putative tryptophan/tyrosine transport system substrate-binding protein